MISELPSLTFENLARMLILAASAGFGGWIGIVLARSLMFRVGSLISNFVKRH